MKLGPLKTTIRDIKGAIKVVFKSPAGPKAVGVQKGELIAYLDHGWGPKNSTETPFHIGPWGDEPHVLLTGDPE